MSGRPAYVYSASDRLAEPHKYMYTPYEGREFLGAYFADRAAFLGKPAASAGEALAWARAALDAGPAGGWGPAGTTAARLEAAVRAMLAGAGPGGDVELMLRRYEVTKKLHRTYDGKRGDGHFLEMAPYALLAVGCGIAVQRGATLKYLNALLKLGDCLVSRRAWLSAEEAALARAALSLETLSVKALMDAQGVRA